MAQYRAEILTIFGSYFGRIDDFINSFRNLMAFRTSFRELVSDDQVKEDALMCRKLIPALDFLKSEENRPQFLLPRRFSVCLPATLAKKSAISRPHLHVSQ